MDAELEIIADGSSGNRIRGVADVFATASGMISQSDGNCFGELSSFLAGVVNDGADALQTWHRRTVDATYDTSATIDAAERALVDADGQVARTYRLVAGNA